MLAFVQWVTGVAAVALAAWLLLRMRREHQRLQLLLQQYELASQRLSQQIEALSPLVQNARRAAARLESTPTNAAAPHPTPECSLSKLEALTANGELPTLAQLGPHALQRHQAAHWPDPFENEEHRLAIARLADQGNSASEIAHRLNRPLGEVELLLSLR